MVVALLLVGALFYSDVSRAESTRAAVIAVIDFRNDDPPYKLHSEFVSQFRAALRVAGLPAVVHFERITLPITGDLKEEIARLEARKPDIYYATTTVIARKIRTANPTVPIVFSGVADPRGAGLVRSIDHPENNMTGFTSYANVDDKRLEILCSLNPRIKRVGYLLQRTPPKWKDEEERAAAERWSVEFAGEVAAKVATARSRGVVLVPLIVTMQTDPRVIDGLIRRHQLDAIDVPTSPYVQKHYLQIIRAARAAQIPLSFRGGGFVELGGVLAYEPREFDYPVKAAQIIAKVVRGTRPADIPIEFPSDFILSINLTAVSALPYEINKAVLRRANQLYP
jgi:putative ABC transport system substrate-binding protein